MYDHDHRDDLAEGAPGRQGAHGLSGRGDGHGLGTRRGARSGPHEHAVTDQKRVLIAACLTGGFMLAEAAGGLLTGSLALLADAGHMLVDSVALFLTWFAVRLAERPATARLAYGFGRVKALVAYTNGLVIVAVALWILVEAWYRFVEPHPVLGGPMLAVAVLRLLVNIAGFVVLHGGDRTSLNMRGAMLHVLGDMLGSAAAIAAALVILATGWVPIDPILSVLVAVLILSTAWSLVRRAARALLEEAPAGLDSDAIRGDLEASVPGVEEIRHLHVRPLDGGEAAATLHAVLQRGVDAQAALRAVKARLALKHGIEHTTIEPEFGLQAETRPRHLH